LRGEKKRVSREDVKKEREPLFPGLRMTLFPRRRSMNRPFRGLASSCDALSPTLSRATGKRKLKSH